MGFVFFAESVVHIKVPDFSDVSEWKKKSVKNLTELDEDLASFTSTGNETDVEEILSQIEAVMDSAQTSEGKTKFSDFKGASEISELEKLVEYNEDKQEEEMQHAKEVKENTIEELNEDSSIDVINKAYQEFKDGDIKYDEYIAIVNATKKIDENGDENSQEFLHLVYTDLENGEIERDVFNNVIQAVNDTELSEMDDDSIAFIEKAYQDYKEDDLDNKTFTTIVSGVMSTGASFITDLLESKVEEKAINATVEEAANWVLNNTELFVDPSGVLVEAGTGAHTTRTLTDGTKKVFRNIINFGKQHGPTFIGTALDASTQVFSGGEDAHHAALKAVGHIGTGRIGTIAGVAIGTTLTAAGASGLLVPIAAVAGGFAIGTLAAKGFDKAYDKWGRDIVDGVVDVGKNVKEGIGNAVSGTFSSLKSVFS